MLQSKHSLTSWKIQHPVHAQQQPLTVATPVTASLGRMEDQDLVVTQWIHLQGIQDSAPLDIRNLEAGQNMMAADLVTILARDRKHLLKTCYFQGFYK